MVPLQATCSPVKLLLPVSLCREEGEEETTEADHLSQKRDCLIDKG
jgi:hypothetical protein